MSETRNDNLRTWVDGVRCDSVPADDRGLSYGDGLFETLLVREGRPRFLVDHLARLAAGCTRLRIPLVTVRELRSHIDTALAGAPPLAVLKIVVTRGSAVRRGYAPGGSEIPRPIVSLWKAAPPPSRFEGVTLVLASLRAADQPALAGIKHLNRLENVLAAGQAQEAGAFEALMLGADERLVSGAMSNLFLVKSGRIRTPFVDRAGVAGVMRGIVLRECAVLGLSAFEEHLTLEDLFAADGAFITNARLGVVPVGHVGEHAFRMNELAQRLAAHIEPLDA